MDKLDPKIVEVGRVMPLIFGKEYESRMILDHTVTGREGVIQMNHGTVKAGYALGGATHEADEIYYILSGNGKIRLDDKVYNVHADEVVFIPAGTFHALDNRDSAEDMKILTFWKNWQDNDAYMTRLREWGVSYREIND